MASLVSLDPDRLQQLPVEIFLNIVIQLGCEPRDIGSLLGSSKRIRFVLKAHEEHLSQQLASYLYPASIASSILPWPILTHPSTPRLEPKHTLLRRLPPFIRFPYTFPWIAEQKTRNKMLRNLSNSPLLNITIPNLIVSIFGTSTRICACCGLSGIKVFKSHGLNMLFRLSDARIAGSTPIEEKKVSINDAQRSQEFWICQQDTLALASMLALVWVASLTFDYGDSSTWGSGGCNNTGHRILGVCYEDGSNLQRRRCTYRELALLHGPYFLWCSVSKSEKEIRWIKEMLDEGVEELEGYEKYEKGCRLVHGSLQSVLLSRLVGLKGWEGEEWDWQEVLYAFGEEILRCRAGIAG